MNKKDNLKEAWQKGQSGNPKGRPPKLITGTIKDLKEQGYQPATAGQIREASEYLITLDREKLTEITKDEIQPMYLRIVAKELLGKKGLDVVNTILDRAHGKPKQGVEHSGEGGGAILLDFTPKVVSSTKDLATDEKDLD